MLSLKVRLCVKNQGKKMPRSYAISVEYSKDCAGHGPDSQTLYVSAKQADLTALLRILDASAVVAGVSICDTVTIPRLAKFSNLTHTDLGLSDGTITKLK